MYITDLFNECEYVLYGGDRNISSLMTNSKDLKQRAVFFARSGENHNGDEYIAEAIENGAICVCSEKKYDLPDGIICVVVKDVNSAQACAAVNLYRRALADVERIAVTGTNGKTSFVHFAWQIFKGCGIKCGYTGTLKTNIDNNALNKYNNTTYEPAVYAELIEKAYEENYRYIFSEISSQGISLGRIEKLCFSAAVFLNLSQDHLDYHKDMESYYQAKKKLFYQTKGPCIINTDDEYGQRLYHELANDGIKVISYGQSIEADYKLFDIQTSLDITSFRLVKDNVGSEIYKFKAIGDYQVYNVAPAIILALNAGIFPAEIKMALSEVSAPQGRMERVGHYNPYVFIDYAHTPEALSKVLQMLESIKKNKLICVFGCGGDRDSGKRSQMGIIASRYADKIIVTDDNPRNERPAKILSDIINEIAYDNFVVMPGRSKAINYALKNAKPDDIILIAGKGHEKYQITGKKHLYFSDIEIVNDYFNAIS